MPKNKSKDESTPVFIPHKNGRNIIKCKKGDHFHEKEIKLLPSKLSNGFIPRRKNSVQPITVTTVAAEIHEQPFQYISPKKTVNVKDESRVDSQAMTVFSIFSSKSKINASNLNNGFVPNGYINVPQADPCNSQVCIVVDNETENESTFIAENNKEKCETANSEQTERESVKEADHSVKDIILPVNPNPVPQTSLDITGINDTNDINDSKNCNLELRETEKKAVKKKVVIATPPSSAMSTRRLATAVRPERVLLAEEIKPVHRLTDLRRMLQPQEEVKDLETTLKAFWESVLDCQCFEWNFNNAAKLITVAVLVLTVIMIINALTKNR